MKTAVKLLITAAVVALGLNVDAQTTATTTTTTYTTTTSYRYSTTSEVYLPGTSYVAADIGASLQGNITSQTTGATITFNPGIRSDIMLGYHVTDPLAVELEAGIIWNSIDKSGGVKLSSVNNEANWYQFPILANVVWGMPVTPRWRPYIGGGIGAVVNSVRFDNGFVNTSDTDVVFGYQAMVGFRFSLTPQMDVGAAYKFLGTTDNHFSRLSGLNTTTFNNSLLAQFTYRF